MKRVRRAGHVAWTRVAEETVVMNLTRKTVLGLNETGGAVWHAIGKGTAEPGQLATSLGRPEATAEIASFLAELEEAGILAPGTEAPDGPPAASAFQAVWERPAIAWCEELPAVVQESPAQEIGNPACGFMRPPPPPPRQ